MHRTLPCTQSSSYSYSPALKSCRPWPFAQSPTRTSSAFCLLAFFCAPRFAVWRVMLCCVFCFCLHIFGVNKILKINSEHREREMEIEILLCSAYVSGLACKCLASIFKYFLPSHTITSLFSSTPSPPLLRYSHFINSIKWKLHGEKTVG